MTPGQRFRIKAKEIIEKFAKENGKSSLFVPIPSYDPTTGVVTAPETEHQAYMVFDDMAASMIKTSAAVAADPELLKENRVVLVAGMDLLIEPEAGHIIKPAGDLKRYKIRELEHDMYKALYILYVARKPEVAT